MPRLDYSITNKDKHLSQQQHHHHGFHMYMWSVWSCTCKWCEHFVTAFCCSQDARDPFRVPSSLCVYVVVIKTIYSVPFKVFPKMYNVQHLLRIASPLHKVKLVHTCADSTTWNRVCLYIRVVGIASSLYICTYIHIFDQSHLANVVWGWTVWLHLPLLCGSGVSGLRDSVSWFVSSDPIKIPIQFVPFPWPLFISGMIGFVPLAVVTARPVQSSMSCTEIKISETTWVLCIVTYKLLFNKGLMHSRCE